MIRPALVALLALPALAAPELGQILKGVEERYNRVRTLEIAFEESYQGMGRARRPETGRLTLKKPGRMRWDYAEPRGKLFLSDGKDFFYYNPVTNQAEKIRMKESEDMRAPLAFLLGKLDFSRDFSTFKTRPEGGNSWIEAAPKSAKLPYKMVEFLVTPAFEIARLVVTGFDNSILTFAFSGEKVNPTVDDKIFRFVLPPGATFVDAARE